MKTLIQKLLLLLVVLMPVSSMAQNDTIVVARDGTGHYRNVAEAIEKCRALMDYKRVIFIKKGIYKEKLVIPSHLTNIELIGEDRDNTIITYDDHANINNMGTFRTYTLKVSGQKITLRNLTIENNAAQLGQAVALLTDGDEQYYINCRFLGNQDTIYTGPGKATQYFTDCYIEGTTDFIFGPATAYFNDCTLKKACKMALVVMVLGAMNPNADPETNFIAYLNDIGFQAFIFFGVLVGQSAIWLKSNSLDKVKDVKALPIRLDLFATTRGFTIGTIGILVITAILYIALW